MNKTHRPIRPHRWVVCPECRGTPVNFRLLSVVMVAGFVCGAASLFVGWWGL